KSKEPGCSPFNLMASTIGDEIRLSTNQKAKVIGIAMKDRAAVLSSGHQANAAYWYDNTTGKWITSSYYMDTLPKWVKEFNRKDFSDFYLEKIWDTMLPMDEYTESLPDDNPYETGLNRTQHVFPYNLAELSEQTRGKKNYNLLNYVPFGNTYTLDFTLAAIINENLGKDTDTDLLIASFSAIDFIGHYFGPRSVEMEDAMLRMDKIIEHLLTFIDDNLGKENVLVFLTADHGVADSPQYMTDRNSPAGIFKQNLCIALLKSYLNALYGEGEWVKDYIEQQIYLNHELIMTPRSRLRKSRKNVRNLWFR
ncbi:MAG: alkaline phosphatase family protein, partial [Bacteroidetes bacterium]|nr:alkaline phosphatase family protein [Bacteroidota bacterium]